MEKCISKRCSLIAVVMTGLFVLPMSSYATSLESVMENIDVDGFVRYRFEANNLHDVDKVDDAFTRVTVYTGFNADITQDVSVYLGTLVDTKTATEPSSVLVNGDAPLRVDLNKVFFDYHPVGTESSVMFGKLTIDTPITDNAQDGQTGNGVYIRSSEVNNWDFGAFYYSNNTFYSPLDEGTFIDPNDVVNVGSKYMFDEFGTKDFYGLKAVASYGEWLNFGTYVSKVNSLWDYHVWLNLEGGSNGFSYKTQYIFADLSNDFLRGDNFTYTDSSGVTHRIALIDIFDKLKTDGAKNVTIGNFQQMWGILLGYDYEDTAYVNVGYTGTGSSGGILNLAGIDSSDVIMAGKLSPYSVLNAPGSVQSVFGVLGAKYDSFGIEGSYIYNYFDFSRVDAKDKIVPVIRDTSSSTEWYVTLSYAYSEDLTFYVYYADYDDEVSIDSQQRVRFQAQYTF